MFADETHLYTRARSCRTRAEPYGQGLDSEFKRCIKWVCIYVATYARHFCRCMRVICTPLGSIDDEFAGCTTQTTFPPHLLSEHDAMTCRLVHLYMVSVSNLGIRLFSPSFKLPKNLSSFML